MAKHGANTEQKNVNLNKPKKPKGGYDWGDGKGKVHSRPKRSGPQLQKAKDQKLLNDPTYFQQPMTLGQATREGERSADLIYGPQIAQTQLQQRQVPAWFDQYRASLQTPAQVAQTYQPALQQVQANQTETAKTTQGVDPNSEAGKQDALAAKAREALVGLGAATLTANQTADTTYMQGRAGVANAAQIGAQTQLGSQLGSLQGQRGAAVSQYVSDARNSERQYGLGVQHQNAENSVLGLNVAKARGVDPVTGKRLPDQVAKRARQQRKATAKAKGKEVNQYGYSNEQWGRFSPSHRRRIIAQSKAEGKSPAAAKPKYTPQQTSTANSKLRHSVALVQQGRKLPSGGDSSYWRTAYDQLVKDGLDPAMARAAIQLVRGGKVGPNTRQTLKDDYGITKFPKGSRRKKPPGTSSGGGGGPEGTGRTTASKASLSRYTPDTDTGGPKFYGKVRRHRNSNPRWAGSGRRSIT